MQSVSLTLTSNAPEETEALARDLALWIKPGMVILLEGDLGAGKSVLARALVRSLAGDEDIDVPSPSFSLMQSYDELRVPLIHADLYRLSAEHDVRELGLMSMLDTHALLVEWPGLAKDLANWPHRLHIHMTGTGQQRAITLIAWGAWQNALARNDSIRTFLANNCGVVPPRAFLQGDASSRRYEQITSTFGTELVMDMPRQPDGPPVRNNLSYSAIAHLAEDIVPVVAINRHLVAQGYSAPLIRAVDQHKGLALVERLDGHVHGEMMRRGADMHEPMQCATEVLASMAAKEWPRNVAAADGVTYTLKDYDVEALLIEVDLLPAWYWKHAKASPAPAGLRQSFAEVWCSILPLAQSSQPYWVLRDYHSPNLIWMPHRTGLQRTGIIDTQDAVMGHPAYDLMSLLQDARCDVPVNLHDELYRHYVALRRAQGEFDADSFTTAYAVLGAQRACKLLGIFVRLCLRDGKPQYLQHLPRQKAYLNRNLSYPALAPLRRWFAVTMPELLA